MSKNAIAKTEGIHESTVRESMASGLKNIQKYIKQNGIFDPESAPKIKRLMRDIFFILR
jgi:hypothetical protein